MELRIGQDTVLFVSLAAFREQHALPDAFGISMFQPKEYAGLGSIDRAGSALNSVREAMLAALPNSMAATDWLDFLPGYSARFEAELHRINDQVGLREEEIAFAVSGFGDVCVAVAYAILRAAMTKGDPPVFEMIYREWLNDTVSVGGVTYEYTHQDVIWFIRVVSHAYGRVGLEVRMPTQVIYVADHALACPAEGFMQGLLAAVGRQMMAATA